MYRSNDPYNENPIQSSSTFPQHHSQLKMQHIDTNYPQNMPPIYYDSNPSQYQYIQPNNEFDPRFSNWREGEQKGHLMMGSLNNSMTNMSNLGAPLSQMNVAHYERPIGNSMHEAYSGNVMGKPMQSSIPQQDGFSQQSQPIQANILQRISSIIKSQLPMLQSAMIYIEKKTLQQRHHTARRERQRSRSRSRDHNKTLKTSKDHQQWTCLKCSYFNFDFRDKCKRCNEAKPEQRQDHATKNYVPHPDDWRCFKCNNINYARRTECHRCHLPRSNK